MAKNSNSKASFAFGTCIFKLHAATLQRQQKYTSQLFIFLFTDFKGELQTSALSVALVKVRQENFTPQCDLSSGH